MTWIATTAGFFSAVAHDDDDAKLVVRTRVKDDALRLATYTYATESHPGHPEDLLVTYARSDYPWRVICHRETFASFIAGAIQGIDYGNFKDAVKDRQGADRAHVYMGVWQTLLRLEDIDPDAQERQGWGSILTEHWGDDEVPIPAYEHLNDDWTGYLIHLECGCRVDLDSERMVEPCDRHAEPPF